MKRILLLTITALLAIGLYAQDTIFYYGYEDGTDPAPHGSIWSSGGATWTPETITDDAAGAHTGSGYFYVEVDGNSPNVWDNQTVFENIPVEDSTSYRLTLWAKNEEASNDTALINITCGNYSYSDIQAKYETRTSAEWQRFHLMVYIAAADSLAGRADTVRFPIHFPRNGTYYLDDVTILKSTIAGIRYNQNRVAVNIGYATDPISKLSDPSVFNVTADGSTVPIDSVTMTIVQEPDTVYIEPYLYLNLGSDIANDAEVMVSFDGSDELVYSAYSPVTENFTVAPFSNEVAVHDPDLDPLTGGGGTDVADVNAATLQVFPNPVQDQLNISSDGSIASVSIMDITGKVVVHNNYNTKASTTIQIGVSHLTNGLYLIQVEDQNGQVTSTKFIK